jgi:glycosyltransferase involved in cell wall biosynthesis
MKDVLISIIIPTYNHEAYIEHAIESALNQKHDYPFEIIVGDDCSTDRTNKICRAYYHNNLIKLIDSETNTGLLENYTRLFSACTGKYIAILEGDDFWHENKLSEQISFLENNSDYGFVHSNAFLLFENNKTSLAHKHSFSLAGDVYNDLFTQNKIVSITVCFRKSL